MVLKTYSDKSTCAKCGFEEATTYIYKPGEIDAPTGAPNDSLKRVCVRCGYYWYEAPHTRTESSEEHHNMIAAKIILEEVANDLFEDSTYSVGKMFESGEPPHIKIKKL